MNIIKWLYPGLRVKRWLFVFWAGLIIFSIGIILMINIKIPISIELTILSWIKTVFHKNISAFWVDMFFVLLGLILMVLGIRLWFKSIYTAIVPYENKKVLEVLLERGHLKQGYKIITMGGGTGLSSLLRGLKIFTSNITAVVAVTDDGGSSGRIREELNILPPGDIRNCLVGLANEESLMSELFQYRFSSGRDLKGHNFGNILLAAMTNITGNFYEAIKLSSKILSICGKVLPATLDIGVLCAELEDGKIVEGESNISKSTSPIKRLFLKPSSCTPLPEVLSAITEADAIILGPGSLYTSVICNLLIPGMIEGIKNSKAVKIYVCNIMTQQGETTGFKASDHLKAIYKYTGENFFDYVILNSKHPSKYLERYKEEGAQVVQNDYDQLAKMNIQTVEDNILLEDTYLRHNPTALAGSIIKAIAANQESKRT
ncbi:MAG: gluconeogenesis factor YvcK family protein [Armatimonadota bacterium]